MTDRDDLRDLFAAAALMGLCANAANDAKGLELIPHVAYKLADVMMKIRERQCE